MFLFRRVLWLALAILLSPASGHGGVATDGSAGSQTAIGKVGSDFAIPSSLGASRGGNLFHSFREFNLATGESATFTGDGFSNIFARVTGGPSNIDGTIRSTIPHANLYFLNPRGVVFGANASIAVEGAFTVSTADEVHFADKSKFTTGAAVTEPLTSAPISAFGFLGPKPAPVTFTGSFLESPAQTGLHIVAGDVSFDEDPEIGAALLTAPGGRFTIFSAASKGTVPFDAAHPGAGYSTAAFTATGTVRLAHGSQLNIDSAEGGGRVVIRSNRLVMTGGSGISALNFGSERGGDIEIKTGQLSMTDFASNIEASPTADGPGGNVTVEAESLQMAGGAGIFAQSFVGAGQAGDLSVRVSGAAELHSGAQIKTTSSSEHANGALTIHAGSLLVDGAEIGSDRASDEPTEGLAFASNPGRVLLDVRGTLRLANGGTISATTLIPGRGADVEIFAGRVEIDGASAAGSSGIRTDVATAETAGLPDASGHGGNLSIRTGDLAITRGGFISASTFGFGNSGKLSIEARGTVRIQDGGSISAATYGAGNAGGLTVEAGAAVTLRSGGVLVSGTQGTGDAGNLRVETPSLLIDGRGGPDGMITGLVAQSRDPGDGKPGSIAVNAATLTLLGGAVIEATTGSANDAGSVTVSANRIVLDGNGAASLPGSGLPLATAISARTLAGSTGNGGDVTVTARDSITLLNRGEVEAATEGRGAGGNVFVRTGSLSASGASFGYPSGVIARGAAGASGNAGNVQVQAADSVHLSDGAAIASNHLGAGAAGNVRVSAGSEVALTHGATITAASRAGDAGTVSVSSAGKITLEGDSDITASAGANGGNVFLQARDLLYLSGSRIVAEAGTVRGATGQAGAGGSIFIDPDLVILDNSTISANAVAGRGGNILLQANTFLSSATPITATGTTSGTVEIAAPELDLSAALAALGARFVDASVRLQERCVMRLGIEASSFLAIGRGGVAEDPDDLQPEIVAGVTSPGKGKVRAR